MAHTTAVVSGADYNRDIFIEDLKSTAEPDLGAMGNSEVHAIDIDARNNPGEDVTVRIHNATTVAVGTDDAEICVRCPKGEQISYTWDDGIPFVTAQSAVCVTEEGAKGGDTSPSGQVDVRIAAKDI